MQGDVNTISKRMILLAILAAVSLACETDEVDPQINKLELQVQMTTWAGLENVWVEVIDGVAIHQGDIVLGPIEEQIVYEDGQYYDGADFNQWILGEQEKPMPLDPGSYLAPTAGSASAGRLWPVSGNQITIDYTIGVTCTWADHIFIDAALDYWEEETDNTVVFSYQNPVTTSSSKIKFKCINVNRCSTSYVGMKSSGNKVTAIYTDNCIAYDGNGDPLLGALAHEIGHAIGMFHEQSRTDRDQYVDIYWNNIQTGKKSNYKKYDQSSCNSHDTNGKNVGVYDYRSLMHYGSCTFAKNAVDCDTDWGVGHKPTITKKTCGMQVPCADEEYLSGGASLTARDKYSVSRMYIPSWYVVSNGGDWIPGPDIENYSLYTDAIEVLSWGRIETADQVAVGKFCEDQAMHHDELNNDDLLVKQNGNWNAYCDGGWKESSAVNPNPSGGAVRSFGNPSGPCGLTLGSLSNFVIGDFDAYLSPQYDENFSDILINHTSACNSHAQGEWLLLQIGEAGVTWQWWNTLTDDVTQLKYGTFCGSSLDTVEDVYRVDALRKTPDGAIQWQVSCGAREPWVTIPGKTVDPATVVFQDLNGDGWSDALRNAPHLMVAWAIPPAAPNPNVTFAPWKELKLKYPGQPNQDNNVKVSRLFFGNFNRMSDDLNVTMNPYYGTDLLRVKDNELFVAHTPDLFNNELNWELINDFMHYPDKPLPANTPLAVGSFRSDWKTMDDVMWQMDSYIK